jgi:hypothetical protein
VQDVRLEPLAPQPAERRGGAGREGDIAQRAPVAPVADAERAERLVQRRDLV